MLSRLYNDYIMPNRYKEYEELLNLFKSSGYEFICVKDYKKLENDKGKYIIIRHDIDSDIKIARKMFEIEKRLNIKTTYYFRLKTANKQLIQDINQYGSEVEYHYEEVAQFCKDNKTVSSQFVIDNLNKIKEEFYKNIQLFEKENNIKLYSIASHGDFINRKISIINKVVYEDEMKEKLGLIEAYDIEKLIDFRTADTMYPYFWKIDPKDAIKENSRKVLILVHTRWWDKAPLERLKMDFERVIEKVKYHN